MDEYHCSKDAMRGCPYSKSCDGTYLGLNSECGKYNAKCLPPTVRQELTAYRATGLTPEEIPRWVPVGERLPVESEYRDKSTGELVPLLVCVKGTEYPFRAMYDGKSWGDGWSRIAVTHWMPLPEPPKEENDARI